MADQDLADLTPVKLWFHGWLCLGSYTAPADHLTLHLQIYTSSEWQFHRFLLWQSYFIPTLRAHIWQTKCWQIYHPTQPSNGNYRFLLWELIFGRSTPPWMAIAQIAALTAHILFLLWELIFGRPSVGRSTTPHIPQMAIIDSYSENSYLADLPLLEWQLHRLLLWQLIFYSYSESSYLADQVLADLLHYPFLIWQL